MIQLLIVCVIVTTLVVYKYIQSQKDWVLVWFKSDSFDIDNTKSDYYKRNGFHEYDTISDIETHVSSFEIYRNVKTGYHKLKNTGSYTFIKLEEIANNELIRLNKETYENNAQNRSNI